MKLTPSHACIYCKGTGKEISREHVIPIAFGTFGGKTPVLRCVCAECNNFFSGEFEQDVYRGSLEAIQRWKQGLKPSETRRQIDSRRIRFNAKGGEIDGLRLDPITNDVEAQIEVRRLDSGQVVHFTLDDLKRLRVAEAKMFDFSKAKLVIWDQGQHEQFSAELLRLGYMVATGVGEMKKVPMPAGTKLSATVTVSMDMKTGRAMAKIAFNYLTAICGPDYVLRDEFDEIRSLIRRGKQPVQSLVVASGMQENARRPVPAIGISHFLTLHLHDEKIVYGRVSLFSGHTYHVALSMDASASDAPRQLQRGIGHRFDLAKKTVTPIPQVALNGWNVPTSRTA